MTDFSLDDFIKVFRKVNKYDEFNKLDFTIHCPGNIEYRLKIQEMHLSTPQSCHGAVIGGLMDCVLGLAALSQAVPLGQLVSTVEYKTNFISQVGPHDELVGKGHVTSQGQSLIVAQGEIINQKTGKLVALGIGTFNLYPLSKKAFLAESLK